MIKVGDRVKVVGLHKRDAYFRDGIAGSKGIVKTLEHIEKIDGINYYGGYILIDNPSDTVVSGYEYEYPFYFAYAQLRKVKK